jgi:hypothetical protein
MSIERTVSVARPPHCRQCAQLSQKIGYVMAGAWVTFLLLGVALITIMFCIGCAELLLGR